MAVHKSPDRCIQRAIGGLLFLPNSHGISWLRNSYVSVIKKENKKTLPNWESGKCVIFLRSKLTLPVGKKKAEKKNLCWTHVCNFRRMKFLSNLERDTEDKFTDTCIYLSIGHVSYLIQSKPSKARYF